MKKLINISVRFLFLIVLLLGAKPLSADEPLHLRQSVRALGMGNAFVAVADDEFALFYNPAGLEYVKESMFQLLSISATVSQTALDIASADDTTSLLSSMAGKKIYADVGVDALSYTTKGWGYALWGSVLADARVINPVVPWLEVTYYVDQAAAVGFSWEYDTQIFLGVTLKQVTREGLERTLYITDLLDTDSLTDSLSSEATPVSVVSGDIGLMYELKSLLNTDESRLGLTLRQPGGMDFGAAGKIEEQVDIGLSGKGKAIGGVWLFAADWVDIVGRSTKTYSPWRNLNFGMEAGWGEQANGHPTFNFRMGMKGPYFSYGTSYNPPYLPLTIDYAHWFEEIGNEAGDLEDERQSVRLSFNW